MKRFGFAQFRFVVAAVLLLAAGLKAYQLATAPLPPVVQGSLFTPLLELLNDRYFLMAVVMGEILFALVLIADLWRSCMWLLSLLGFSVFTLVSLMKGLSGEASCGCFGTVTVNPWITMILDLVIVACLIVFRPEKSNTKSDAKSRRWSTAQSPGDRKKVLAVLLVWFVLAAPALFFMLSLKEQPHATLGTEFIGAGGRKVIQLEPETWIGKGFPLVPYFSQPRGAGVLQRGEWSVLLIHTDCKQCLQMMRDWERKKATNVAIVVVPLYANERILQTPFPTFMLNNQNDWLAVTPKVVRLSDGVCVSTDEQGVE